jgi:hypothetical protein
MSARSLSRLALAAAVMTSLGCSDSPTGQIVLGLVTDLPWSSAPFNVHVVVLKPLPDSTAPPIVAVDDVVPLSTTMGLPGTYVLQSDSQIPVRVQVSAVERDGSEPVVRAAVLSIMPREVRFLRLGLVKSCLEKETVCGTKQTCVEGACVSPLIAPDDLVDYDARAVTTLDCAGPSRLVTTATSQPMPFRGTCAAGRTCLEGSCRLTGQAQ